MKIIKPQLLKQGDTIGILAVSGCMEDDTNLKRAVEFFKNRGFNVKLSDNIYSKKSYLAGSDDERVDALHNMFLDKSVNAIIALRGGYGAIRLLDKIDYDIIRNNAKIFCGYSDITVMNAIFLKRANLMTYSAPMILSDFGCENICRYTVDKFFETVMYDKFDYSGAFWGGNLASLTSLCGLDFVPDFEFNLFLEDLNEPVYKIDRMMNQLMNVDKLRKNIRAIYLGDFLDIDDEIRFNELFDEISKNLNVPAIKGFPASHGAKKLTIPYGLSIKNE